MTEKEIVERLLIAKNEKEFREVLQKHCGSALALARELRALCYDFWVSDPKKTSKIARILSFLSEETSDKQVYAFYLWTSGISALVQSKFDIADKLLQQASEIFSTEGNELDSANCQVARLISLSFLGETQAAVEAGIKALKIFEDKGDYISAGKIELNLSNVLSRVERHKAAERFCLSALKRFSRIGEERWCVMAENGLANTYMEMNDFTRAEHFYLKALDGARKLKMPITEAEIEASIGNLNLFRGRFGEALRYFESSRQKFEQLGAVYQKASAELEISNAYLELNLLNEAIVSYGQVIRSLSKLKLRFEEAFARLNRAQALLLLGEKTKARRELEKAEKLYAEENDAVGLAKAKIIKSRLELDEGHFQEARRLAKEASELFKSTSVRYLLRCKWLEAEAERKLGKIGKAEASLEKLIKLSRKYEEIRVLLATLNSLGELSLGKSDKKSAKSYFRQAVKLVEKLRSSIPAEDFKISFFASHLSPFENLLDIYLAERRLKAAILLFEKSKARALAESLGRGDLVTSYSGEFIREFRLQREKLNWFYSRLNRAKSLQELKQLQSQVKLCEKKLMRMELKIKNKSQQVGLVSTTLNIDLLFEQLGSRALLVEFVKRKNVFSAFLLRNGEIEFFPNLFTEAEILQLLESIKFQIGTFAYGAQRLKRFLDELKERFDRCLEELFRRIFRKLFGYLKEDEWIIVPSDILHYVPFHALRFQNAYLIESKIISYSPSSTIWQELTERVACAPCKGEVAKDYFSKPLLMGFADDKIPLVNKEIEVLQRVLPTAKSFCDDAATISNYFQNAPDADLIHLACHASFRADNPRFSGLHLFDGWLTTSDISSVSIKANLVTLSACETGLSKIYPAEEILGLMRAFLIAGARGLVLSLWPVNDQAALRLMHHFYLSLSRTSDPINSLIDAQRKMIQENFHPYFWAPFFFVGARSTYTSDAN